MQLLVKTEDIAFQATAHGKGLKKVLLAQPGLPPALTQVAMGKMMPGEQVEAHHHPTMDEIFYFLKGSGTYQVKDEIIPVEPGSLIRIPAGFVHALSCTGEDPLEFFYFGIAT